MNPPNDLRRPSLLLIFLLGLVGCTQSYTQKTSLPTQTTTVAMETSNVSSLWYLTRGGAKLDQGWGVDTDAEGNVYFATFQQAAGELFTDMVIYKFAPDGTEIWHTRWGGKFEEKAFIVTVREPYAYVGGLTSHSMNPLESDMAVIALNTADGSLAWDFTWSPGYGYQEVDGLIVDGENLFVSGWTTSKTTGNDVAILKLNTDGQLQWAKSWGGNGWDEGDGQMVVDNDTIYVAGRFNGANILLGGQGLIVRFSKETGEYLSHTTWGGPVFTDALGMTTDGTYLYAVGLTLDKGDGGQIFLRKFDKNLDLIWERIWGGKGSESARAVAVGPSGDIYVAGESDNGGSGNGLNIAFLRYNPSGDLIWARTWGGSKNEGALGIVLYGDYAYIAGKTLSYGSGQDDAILIKVDSRNGLFPSAG